MPHLTVVPDPDDTPLTPPERIVDIFATAGVEAHDQGVLDRALTELGRRLDDEAVVERLRALFADDLVPQPLSGPTIAAPIGAPGAEPYAADELTAVRPIIGRYNRPTSVQRRLLATIDALTAEVRP